jgi:hypothetical protein
MTEIQSSFKNQRVFEVTSTIHICDPFYNAPSKEELKNDKQDAFWYLPAEKGTWECMTIENDSPDAKYVRAFVAYKVGTTETQFASTQLGIVRVDSSHIGIWAAEKYPREKRDCTIKPSFYGQICHSFFAGQIDRIGCYYHTRYNGRLLDVIFYFESQVQLDLFEQHGTGKVCRVEIIDRSIENMNHLSRIDEIVQRIKEKKPSPCEFEVTSTIHICDPCYEAPLENDDDEQYAFWNIPVEKGTWEYSYMLYPTNSSSRYWGALIAFKKGTTCIPDGPFHLTRQVIGVDSGQVGIWDAIKYPGGGREYNDEDGFYRKVCNTSKAHIANSIDRTGCFCKTTYGDGLYDVILSFETKNTGFIFLWVQVVLDRKGSVNEKQFEFRTWCHCILFDSVQKE